MLIHASCAGKDNLFINFVLQEFVLDIDLAPGISSKN